MKIVITADANYEMADPDHSTGLTPAAHDQILNALLAVGLDDIDIEAT